MHPVKADLEAAILKLLSERGEGKTICPSEVARRVNPADWEALMQPVRDAGKSLAIKGLIVVTRRGLPVDIETARGPIRLKKV